MRGLLAFGTFYAVLWIGLLGSLILRRSRTRTDCVRLLWAAILSFLLLHTFYWTNTRMRAPLTGAFAVLAVAGWREWLALLRRYERQRRKTHLAGPTSGPHA